MTQSDIIQALERVREALDTADSGLYTAGGHEGHDPQCMECAAAIMVQQALNDFPSLQEAVKELQAKLDALEQNYTSMEQTNRALLRRLDAALAEPTQEEVFKAHDDFPVFRGDPIQTVLTNFIKGRRS